MSSCSSLGVGAPLYLLLAVLMTLFQLAILTAVAVLFSTFSTPITGAVFTFAVYFVGHLTRDLKLLAAMSPSPVVKAVSYAPLLRPAQPEQLQHPRRGRVRRARSTRCRWCCRRLYALVYTATLLLISATIFNRKEF